VSHSKLDKFAKMANQISDAFAAEPAEKAAASAASHIRKFWTPKMIAETLGAWERGDVSVNATSARAFAMLKAECSKATPAESANRGDT
jgi:formate dehydrogenase subunit delta